MNSHTKKIFKEIENIRLKNNKNSFFSKIV